MAAPTATGYVLNSLQTLGHTITVVGRPAGVRVAINLLVNNDDQNIGFHFNPRFDQKEIVMNNRVNGHWQTEQRARKGDFMWSQSSFAAFKIKVESNEITCSWNGQKLSGCTFQHRVNANTYSGLQVVGFDVRRLDIEDNNNSAKVETILNVSGDAVLEKNIRLFATIVNTRSSVNFKVNDSDDNFALHFNPRFDQKVIVRNSKVNGAWQNEERNMVVPFTWQMNQQYEFDIYVGRDYFSCVWEGTEVCRFNHRFPAAQCVGLMINGMSIQGTLIL